MKRALYLKISFFLVLCGAVIAPVSSFSSETETHDEAVEPITPYVAVIPLTDKEIENYETFSFSDKLGFLYEYYVKNKKQNVTDEQIFREMMRLDDDGGLVALFTDLKGTIKSVEAAYHRTVDEINQAILEKYPGRSDYLINTDDKSTWKNIRYYAFGDKSLDDFFKSFKDERFYSQIYTAPYGQFRLAACANLKNKKRVNMALIALMTPGYRILRQIEGEAFIPLKTNVRTSEGISVSPIEYPLTSVFNVGDDRAYGYAGKTLFPFKIEFATPGSPANVSLTATLRVCDADGTCKDETTEPLNYSFPADAFLETPVCPDLREAAMSTPAEGLSGLTFKSAGFKENAGGELFLFAKFKLPPVNMDTPVLHIANTNGIRFEKPFFVGTDGDALFRAKVLNPEHLKKIGKADLILTTFNLNKASEFSVKLSLKDVFSPETDKISLFKMILSFLEGIKFILLTPLYLLMSLFLYQMLFVRGKDARKTLEFSQGAWYGLALFFSFVAASGFVIFLFDIRFVWGSQLGSPFLNVFLAAAFLTAPSWMMKLFNDDAAEKAAKTAPRFFKAAGMETSRQKAGMLSALSVGVLTLFSPMIGTYFQMYALIKPFPAVYGLCFVLGIIMPFLAALIYYEPAAKTPVKKPRFLKHVLFLQAYVHAFLIWMVVGAESGLKIWLGTAAFAAAAVFILKRFGNTARIKQRLAAFFFVLAVLFVPFRPNEFNFSGYAAYPFDEKKVEEAVKEGKAVYVNVSEDACLACHYNRLAMLFYGGTTAVRAGKLIIMTAPYDTPYLKELLGDTGMYALPSNIIFGPAAPQGMLLPRIIHPTPAGIAVSEMFRFQPY